EGFQTADGAGTIAGRAPGLRSRGELDRRCVANVLTADTPGSNVLDKDTRADAADRAKRAKGLRCGLPHCYKLQWHDRCFANDRASRLEFSRETRPWGLTD